MWGWSSREPRRWRLTMGGSSNCGPETSFTSRRSLTIPGLSAPRPMSPFTSLAPIDTRMEPPDSIRERPSAGAASNEESARHTERAGSARGPAQPQRRLGSDGVGDPHASLPAAVRCDRYPRVAAPSQDRNRYRGTKRSRLYLRQFVSVLGDRSRFRQEVRRQGARHREGLVLGAPALPERSPV